MRALLVSSFALLLGSCAIGAPPGFSDGDTWAFPLVGPLESGVFLAPVKVNGKGPWLFAIDPDLGVSAVDPGIQTELKLMPESGMQVLNFEDNMKPLARARVNELEVGDLKVRNRLVFVKPAFQVRGRWVRGVLGRDVIAPSLIFALDRDRGMAYLATQGSLKAPADAKKMEYSLVNDRFLADVTINDKHDVTLHLDFGNPRSSLWPSKQDDAGLPRLPKKGQTRDEFGFTQGYEKVGMAAKTRAGEIESDGIEFAPMLDKRVSEADYDGELGLNFFFPYNVTVNWHKTTLWLKARTQDVAGTAKSRMRRWGNRFDSCKFAACVLVQIDPMGGKQCPQEQPAKAAAGGDAAGAPAPDAVAGEDPAVEPAEPCTPVAPEFYQLRIGREALAKDLEYEVMLMAVDDNERPLGAPILNASLPKGADTVFHPLRDPAYAKAKTFLAVDMSPFPRPCEKVGAGYRCVWPVE